MDLISAGRESRRFPYGEMNTKAILLRSGLRSTGAHTFSKFADVTPVLAHSYNILHPTLQGVKVGASHEGKQKGKKRVEGDQPCSPEAPPRLHSDPGSM